MFGTDSSNPETTDQPRPAWDFRSQLRIWARDLLLAFCFVVVIMVFLYQPVKVEGTSMAPLISDQERVFINKFVYRLEPIHRGDVVVFRYPRDTSKSYIKRVIALPGDRVRIDTRDRKYVSRV